MFDLNILLDLLKKEAENLSSVAEAAKDGADDEWKGKLENAIGAMLATAAFTAEIAGLSEDAIVERGESMAEAFDNQYPGLMS